MGFTDLYFSHQSNSNKPRSSKCRHFCFLFDTHKYCPTCRESGRGVEPYVIGDEPCQTCAGFTEEQLLKIKHRRRYVRKQKASDTSKDDLDLLGEEVEVFSGSQANLEGAADDLFSSPPCPQPLRF